MSTTPDTLTPGDPVDFEAPSGAIRTGIVCDTEFAPTVTAQDRYRITVTVDGTTLAITSADLCGPDDPTPGEGR